MYVYLVFSKTGTWLSRVLTFVTGEKYVHTSISLDQDLKTMYSFGRVRPNNPFSAGFIRENFNKGVFLKQSNCECIVYRIKINEIQHAMLINEISRFIASDRSFRYNFLGLFTAAMNIPMRRENYYFCSQFVSELLIKINLLQNSFPPELIKPMDLYHIEGKEEIYKGFTWQYGTSSLGNTNRGCVAK
ncbi:hypothetical protein Desde_1011 [Desulfitobacterium dehalogenans ATCC 51507]|uniref:Uncharacterized protein n=1 Tax=Desulfitobacterium dehalogenans (strain ATCC 51507 / DSM 9161 / JW/IU-DC1) TaxID=756499 RepID=I4A660_DESDJ|nr:hypothetical protein Desde_1011 [Desulfitobacterium dehalogenans ATCC 51507]